MKQAGVPSEYAIKLLAVIAAGVEFVDVGVFQSNQKTRVQAFTQRPAFKMQLKSHVPTCVQVGRVDLHALLQKGLA